jgi:TonB family protein
VLHKEIPEVPRSARNTIRGHFSIAVRVTVDKSGNVIGESLEKPGPSKYFARLAAEAARKWKFAPADTPDSRQCLVWFEFTRGGASGHAATARS